MASWSIGETVAGKSVGYKSNVKCVWLACPDCGKQRWVQVIKGKPTSLRCRHCSLSRNSQHQEGEANPQWKGGHFISTGGYILIKDREHHRANVNGYVYEHIKVWEQVHQKHIPKGYVIHHLNGIKIDNRPENLVAIPRSEHMGHSLPYKKRIRELEATIELLEQALKNNQMIFGIGEN